MLLSRLFGKRKKPRYEVSGRLFIHALPPSQGYFVNLKLLRVASPDTGPPYGGDPPAEAYEGAVEVAREEHLGETRQRPSIAVPFTLEAEAGYYYLGLSVILFREGAEGLLAQLERFCFGGVLLDLSHDHLDAGELPIPWPATKLEDMHRYATFRPNEPPEFYE